MSRVQTDITIEEFGNAPVFRVTELETDNLTSRFENEVLLSTDLIPSTTQQYTIGNTTNLLANVHSIDSSVTGNGYIHNVIVNDMLPEDGKTITFFGNLFPSLDFTYNLGIPTQRWKQLQTDDISAFGNVDFSNAQLEFTDSNTIIQDDIDSTKRFRFQAAGITTGTLREYIVPDGDTTIVGNDFPQTLTNKTITGATNLVEAHRLATANGTSVIIDTATFPTNGQLLSYFTATNGVWADPSAVISGSAVTDNQFISADGLISIPKSQTIFVDISGMTLTANVPGDAANYLFLFNATTNCSNNNTTLDFAFAVNGITISGTVIRITPETKERNVTVFFTGSNISDGDVITSRWRVSAGSGSGELTFRGMTVLGFGTQ